MDVIYLHIDMCFSGSDPEAAADDLISLLNQQIYLFF